jgi:hypothetical protein
MIGAGFARVDSEEGRLEVRVTFLGQRQRFWLHDHRTGGMHPCSHVPIAAQSQVAVLDSNEAPRLTLVSGDRFTVLAFEDGCVVAAATFACDGKSIVRQAQIGEPIQIVWNLVEATPLESSSEATRIQTVPE